MTMEHVSPSHRPASPVASMLRNESQAMPFHLPQLPPNIVQEMVYKRTKPKQKTVIKSIPEKQVIQERKNHKRIFTEGISEVSRLNYVGFQLGTENFNPNNVPDQQNYYKSRRDKSIHLTAWYQKRKRTRSTSPEQKPVQKPLYGYYKQGVPGGKSLTLPKLSMPTDFSRQVSSVRFAPDVMDPTSPAKTPRVKSNYSRIPPNTPNVPATKRLSLGIGLETSSRKTPRSENGAEVDAPIPDVEITTPRDEETQKVALKRINIGADSPSVLNVETKQKVQLREMYPMYDSLESRKENQQKIPPKWRGRKEPDRKQNGGGKTNENQKSNEHHPIMHTQIMKIMIPRKDFIEADDKSREDTKSVEIPSKPLLDEHLDTVKNIAKGNNELPKEGISHPNAPPPSAKTAQTPHVHEENKTDAAEADSEVKNAEEENTMEIVETSNEKVQEDNEKEEEAGNVGERKDNGEEDAEHSHEERENANENIQNPNTDEVKKDEQTAQPNENDDKENNRETIPNENTDEQNANNNNNALSTDTNAEVDEFKERVRKHSGQSQVSANGSDIIKTRQTLSHRTSSMLEVPMYNPNTDMERPPSSLAGSVEEEAVNGERNGEKTPEIHISKEEGEEEN